MKEQLEKLLAEHGATAFLWAVHDAFDGIANPDDYTGEIESRLAALAEFAQDNQ